MYYLTDFKHFVSTFPSFSIQLTPFSINFKFVDPSFLQKLRSDWVHFFFRVLYPGTENLMKYPPRDRSLSICIFIIALVECGGSTVIFRSHNSNILNRVFVRGATMTTTTILVLLACCCHVTVVVSSPWSGHFLRSLNNQYKLRHTQVRGRLLFVS